MNVLGHVYPLDPKEWRRPFQLYKICLNTLIWPSSQSTSGGLWRVLIPSKPFMAAEICVLGLILYSYPYLRSAMVRFPLSDTISGIFSEIPIMMPDAWLYRRAHISWPLVIRHHYWDLKKDPRNGAWQLSGTSFGTARHQFWDSQAPVLGLSGTSFGISRLF